VTFEELVKKVQVLEDLEEIKKLHGKYINCLSSRKWDDLAECFSEDGSIKIGVFGPFKGQSAIAKLFKEEIGLRHIGREWIIVTNPDISVEGDQAKGNWIVFLAFFPDPEEAQPKYRQSGIYNCEYIKEKGHWKISNLEWEPTLLLGPQPARIINLQNKLTHK
jgi:hypothetical protein